MDPVGDNRSKWPLAEPDEDTIYRRSCRRSFLLPMAKPSTAGAVSVPGRCEGSHHRHASDMLPLPPCVQELIFQADPRTGLTNGAWPFNKNMRERNGIYYREWPSLSMRYDMSERVSGLHETWRVLGFGFTGLVF